MANGTCPPAVAAAVLDVGFWSARPASWTTATAAGFCEHLPRPQEGQGSIGIWERSSPLLTPLGCWLLASGPCSQRHPNPTRSLIISEGTGQKSERISKSCQPMRYRNTNLIRGKTVFILTLPRAHINSIRYYIIIGHCISKSIQGWKEQTKDKRCNQ